LQTETIFIEGKKLPDLKTQASDAEDHQAYCH
jgi:hypothetical protein